MKKSMPPMGSSLPVYPSMQACEAATGIPKAIQQQSKRDGCTAFDQANRVHLEPLLRWLFGKGVDGEEYQNWPDRLKRAQALIAEHELLVTQGRLVERSWVAERIQRIAGELNVFRAKSEAEHPLRFAAANSDVALCRTIVRGMWDEIFADMAALSKHLKE